jgi:hypothetical protein
MASAAPLPHLDPQRQAAAASEAGTPHRKLNTQPPRQPQEAPAAVRDVILTLTAMAARSAFWLHLQRLQYFNSAA